MKCMKCGILAFAISSAVLVMPATIPGRRLLFMAPGALKSNRQRLLG